MLLDFLQVFLLSVSLRVCPLSWWKWSKKQTWARETFRASLHWGHLIFEIIAKEVLMCESDNRNHKGHRAVKMEFSQYYFFYLKYFWFWDHIWPCSGLPTLHSGIIPGGVRRAIWDAKIEPGPAGCKANALSSVLQQFWALHYCFINKRYYTLKLTCPAHYEMQI